jgi:hypothetical protein
MSGTPTFLMLTRTDLLGPPREVIINFNQIAAVWAQGEGSAVQLAGQMSPMVVAEALDQICVWLEIGRDLAAPR